MPLSAGVWLLDALLTQADIDRCRDLHLVTIALTDLGYVLAQITAGWVGRCFEAVEVGDFPAIQQMRVPPGWRDDLVRFKGAVAAALNLLC